MNRLQSARTSTLNLDQAREELRDEHVAAADLHPLDHLPAMGVDDRDGAVDEVGHES
jgi:hypothetical protein